MPVIDWEKYTRPVDPELFLWCSGIYQAAAHLTMPVENPASRPFVADGEKVYALADIPINRGMLAVMKELRERGLSDEEKLPFTVRLMHFGEIFNQPELEAFFQPSEESGAVMISEALIKACATARFIREGDGARFDIADIARIAARLTAEEEANDA